MSVRRRSAFAFSSVLALAAACSAPGVEGGDSPEARGFRPLWNGKDLAGWHGRRPIAPAAYAAMPAAERAKVMAEDAATVAAHWRVVDGELVNDGEGAYLTTDREFGDAEYLLDWRIVPKADSGVYLRGTPQVQIWDCTAEGGKHHLGADKGSGGLWNNEKHARHPLVFADRPLGEWNRFRIRQTGDRTWVWLNDRLVVDGVVMENYWDRNQPLPSRGPLQLQTHGGEVRWRELWVRDLSSAEAAEPPAR